MQHALPFIVPIVAILGSFILVAVLRYMKHVERLNLIERGIGLDELAKSEQKRDSPYGVAYMLIGAAAGLLAAIVVTRLTASWINGDEGVGLYFAFIGLGAGLGLLKGRKEAANQ